MKNNVIDFMGFMLTGKKMSPERYSEIVQYAMDNKPSWENRTISHVNIVVALALKNKNSWCLGSKT